MIARTGIVLLLLGIPSVIAQEGANDPLSSQGEALAQVLCAQCHAIGRSGSSPHSDAPPLRDLGRRMDLDSFAERLRDQLMVPHPDMPSFRFTREDARAFVFYLRSIQMR